MASPKFTPTRTENVPPSFYLETPAKLSPLILHSSKSYVPVAAKPPFTTTKDSWQSLLNGLELIETDMEPEISPIGSAYDLKKITSSPRHRSPLRQVTNQVENAVEDKCFLKKITKSRPKLPLFQAENVKDEKEFLVNGEFISARSGSTSGRRAPASDIVLSNSTRATHIRSTNSQGFHSNRSSDSDDGSNQSDGNDSNFSPIPYTSANMPEERMFYSRSICWTDPTNFEGPAVSRRSTIVINPTETQSSPLVTLANALILTTPTARHPGPIEIQFNESAKQRKPVYLTDFVTAVYAELSLRHESLVAEEVMPRLSSWVEPFSVDPRIIEQIDGQALAPFEPSPDIEWFVKLTSPIPVIHGFIPAPEDTQVRSAIVETATTSTGWLDNEAHRASVRNNMPGLLDCIDQWYSDNKMMATQFGIHNMITKLGYSKVAVAWYAGQFTTIITCPGVSFGSRELRASLRGNDVERIKSVLNRAIKTKAFELVNDADDFACESNIVWKELTNRGLSNYYSGDFNAINLQNTPTASAAKDRKWRPFKGKKINFGALKEDYQHEKDASTLQKPKDIVDCNRSDYARSVIGTETERSLVIDENSDPATLRKRLEERFNILKQMHEKAKEQVAILRQAGRSSNTHGADAFQRKGEVMVTERNAQREEIIAMASAQEKLLETFNALNKMEAIPDRQERWAEENCYHYTFTPTPQSRRRPFNYLHQGPQRNHYQQSAIHPPFMPAAYPSHTFIQQPWFAQHQSMHQQLQHPNTRQFPARQPFNPYPIAPLHQGSAGFQWRGKSADGISEEVKMRYMGNIDPGASMPYNLGQLQYQFQMNVSAQPQDSVPFRKKTPVPVVLRRPGDPEPIILSRFETIKASFDSHLTEKTVRDATQRWRADVAKPFFGSPSSEEGTRSVNPPPSEETNATILKDHGSSCEITENDKGNGRTDVDISGAGLGLDIFEPIPV